MSTQRARLVVLIGCVLLLVAGGGVGQARPAPCASSGGPLYWWWLPISEISEDPGHPNQQDPAAAYNSQQHQYLVVWRNDYTDSPPDWKIYGRRVTRDGTVLGDSFLISSAGDYCEQPDVAYNSARNEYLVVYRRSDWDIRARRISAAGVPQGGEITVFWGSVGNFGYRNPVVAYAATADKYLVVAHCSSMMGTGSIRAQALQSDGTVDGSYFEIASSLITTPLGKPDVAYNSARDEFLVVWEQRNTDGDYDILGRRATSAGAASPSFPVIALGNEETNPAVAAISQPAGVGQYLVVCERLIGSTKYIRAQRVAGTGSLEGSYIAVSSESNQETEPAVAGWGNSQTYLVVWKYEHMDESIRAREVYAGGTMGNSTLLYAWYADNPAVTSGTAGDFMINTDDSLMSSYADVYAKLWGNRYYLPLIAR